MTLAEIMQAITLLSAEDRAILRRELDEMVSRSDVEDVSPELRTQMDQERRSAHDERDLPIEDALEPPKSGSTESGN
jgi:hypothetical protein